MIFSSSSASSSLNMPANSLKFLRPMACSLLLVMTVSTSVNTASFSILRISSIKCNFLASPYIKLIYLRKFTLKTLLSKRVVFLHGRLFFNKLIMSDVQVIGLDSSDSSRTWEYQPRTRNHQPEYGSPVFLL